MRNSTPSLIDLTGWRPPPGESLSPVPVPPIASPPPSLARLHLDQTEPLDDPGAVALQLAMLTATVHDLVVRLGRLEAWGGPAARRSARRR